MDILDTAVQEEGSTHENIDNDVVLRGGEGFGETSSILVNYFSG